MKTNLSTAALALALTLSSAANAQSAKDVASVQTRKTYDAWVRSRIIALTPGGVNTDSADHDRRPKASMVAAGCICPSAKTA